jgi:excisionase family DNA binding protein
MVVSVNQLEPAKAADWISQAEAARIRGTTRQAIARLVARGRLKTFAVGGRTLVSRSEVSAFVPATAGRKKRDD